MEVLDGELPFDQPEVNGWRGCLVSGQPLFRFVEDIKNYRYLT